MQFTTTQKKTPKWDDRHSTYYWKIYLDKTHPRNSQSVEFLEGYSKKETQHENPDTEMLLKRKILNLFLNGYYDRINRIEYYLRADIVINKSTDPLIVTCYPKHYVINELNGEKIFKKFGVFLNEFYFRIVNKKSMDNLLPQKKSNIKTADDFLKVEKYNFSNIGQLYGHATRCIHFGHPTDAVESFIIKYKQLKNW